MQVQEDIPYGGTASRTVTLLVVSEDPEFVERVRDRCRPSGARVVACLGPSQSPCLMDVKESCGLAANAEVVLVDSPPTGVFGGCWGTIPAGSYAEKLAARHPSTFVILVAPVGLAGPTGEVTSVSSRERALDLVGWTLA